MQRVLGCGVHYAALTVLSNTGHCRRCATQSPIGESHTFGLAMYIHVNPLSVYTNWMPSMPCRVMNQSTTCPTHSRRQLAFRSCGQDFSPMLSTCPTARTLCWCAVQTSSAV